MTPMITKLHNVTCPFGYKCCAKAPSGRSKACKTARRALAKRDRRMAKETLRAMLAAA